MLAENRISPYSCREDNGTVKERINILQGTLPVTLLKHRDDMVFAFIDQLLLMNYLIPVCCAIINLSPGVVPS